MAFAGYGRLHKQQRVIAQVTEDLINSLEIFESQGILIVLDKVREELATSEEVKTLRLVKQDQNFTL